jgi:hypothetical protein
MNIQSIEKVKMEQIQLVIEVEHPNKEKKEIKLHQIKRKEPKKMLKRQTRHNNKSKRNNNKQQLKLSNNSSYSHSNK